MELLATLLSTHAAYFQRQRCRDRFEGALGIATLRTGADAGIATPQPTSGEGREQPVRSTSPSERRCKFSDWFPVKGSTARLRTGAGAVPPHAQLVSEDPQRMLRAEVAPLSDFFLHSDAQCFFKPHLACAQADAPHAPPEDVEHGS